MIVKMLIIKIFFLDTIFSNGYDKENNLLTW